MLETLPFRRCSLVDDTLCVRMSGPARESLAPAGNVPLEPALADEVRRLRREMRMNAGSTGAGLLGLDYRIQLESLAGSEAGSILVSIRRIAIRRGLEAIGRRHALTAEQLELGRLIAGGYGFPAIAMRLGLAPSDAKDAIQKFLAKTMFATTTAFADHIFSRMKHVRCHAARPIQTAWLSEKSG